jgi:hypothetical protein
MAGEGRLDGVEISNNDTRHSSWIPATAVFTFIGALPVDIYVGIK